MVFLASPRAILTISRVGDLGLIRLFKKGLEWVNRSQLYVVYKKSTLSIQMHSMSLAIPLLTLVKRNLFRFSDKV